MSNRETRDPPPEDPQTIALRESKYFLASFYLLIDNLIRVLKTPGLDSRMVIETTIETLQYLSVFARKIERRLNDVQK